jgi:hypothetical protein
LANLGKLSIQRLNIEAAGNERFLRQLAFRVKTTCRLADSLVYLSLLRFQARSLTLESCGLHEPLRRGSGIAKTLLNAIHKSHSLESSPSSAVQADCPDVESHRRLRLPRDTTPAPMIVSYETHANEQ